MTVKDTYFLVIFDSENNVHGVGECALFKGLSSEDDSTYTQRLDYYCKHINDLNVEDIHESSIKFGFETALLDLKSGGKKEIFVNTSELSEIQIPINGLVWMGDFDTMYHRVCDIVQRGFKCVKLKIGGIDFEKELQLVKFLRESFNITDLNIRLDANGSMNRHNAVYRLEQLARYEIHSIEQPLKPRQWNAMHDIAQNTPIPIALDEELIGNFDYDHRCYMLDAIMPQYIILKPSLHGGFNTCDGWIYDALEREIGWWATSALESNIGLNAIAQWAWTKHVIMPQGLGTGSLYFNNIPSPWTVKNGILRYNSNLEWGQMERQ